MLYVDSNVFLYSVIYDPVAVPKAVRAEKGGSAGGSEGLYCHRHLGRNRVGCPEGSGSQHLSASGENVPELSEPEYLAVRRTTILKAQELMEKYELKPRDALHAATALKNKLTTIASFDEDFDRVKVI